MLSLTTFLSLNASSGILLLVLGGCAFDIAHVDYTPTRLDLAAACGEPFTLAEDVSVRPSGGYDRTLKQGARWECVGNIAEGSIYRSRDQILTLEASNIYEAQLVIRDGLLVGFYLPVEEAFSPLSKPIALQIR